MQLYKDKEYINTETACNARQIDAGMPAVSIRLYAIIKRMLDFTLSLLSLIALSPIMLIISMVVWLDDPHGSPLYISKRCGKDGREFNFYKFRSMCIDAEKRKMHLSDLNEMDGPVFKIKDDPRITRVGKLIRRVNIDELPQLFNVLMGQMSLVGPRPPLPNEVAEYTPRQMDRLSVQPGITCLWQVQPQRNDISFNDWVELDLQYIRERSLKLDVELIFKTILVVLHAEGC